MLAITLEGVVILCVVFVLFAAFGLYFALWKAWKKIDSLEERLEKVERRSMPSSYLDENGQAANTGENNE